MLVSKSFLVVGNTTHRDGAPHKDIAEKVDAEINAFLSDLKNSGGKLVDLKPNVQIGTMTDTAFITIIIEVDDKKVEEEKKEDAPVKTHWRKQQK